MWMLWLIAIVVLPVMGLTLWGYWNNRQVDKYEEEQKQKAAQGVAVTV